MVRWRAVVARRRVPNSGKLWSNRAARPSTPSTSTRGAANSIASGKTVQPAANLADEQGVRIGQREVVDNCGDAFDKQLYRGESRRLGGRQSGRCGRAAERSEAVLVLACDPERLAARRQDIDPRHSAENRRHQAGRRVDHMLAIIEAAAAFACL